MVVITDAWQWTSKSTNLGVIDEKPATANLLQGKIGARGFDSRVNLAYTIFTSSQTKPELVPSHKVSPAETRSYKFRIRKILLTRPLMSCPVGY